MNDGKKRILVIDDDPEIIGLLSKILTDHGFECAKAYNGKEGLEAARSFDPDLILLDLRMPEMDGLTVLGELRKEEAEKNRSNVPVIVLSGVNDDESVSKAMEGGVLDYIEKTEWSAEELVSRIREKLPALMR